DQGRSNRAVVAREQVAPLGREAVARLRSATGGTGLQPLHQAAHGQRGQVLAYRVVADAQPLAQLLDTRAFAGEQQLPEQPLLGIAEMCEPVRHAQLALSGNCLAMAPASASAIMSMCDCIAVHSAASPSVSPARIRLICCEWCAPCASSIARTPSSGRLGFAPARNFAISPALLLRSVMAWLAPASLPSARASFSAFTAPQWPASRVSMPSPAASP